MTQCSIVIRAYNEAQHLPKLLAGIKQQTVQDVEIILVDSGSTDKTVEIAQSFGAKIVRINPSEFTFGRSLNLGIQAATRELVVIASAHVYPVYPDWLEKLVEPFSNNKVALSYGRQKGMATTQYSEHQIFARWFPAESNINQTQPFCNNANAAIRRSLWQNQLYDESLTGLEDLAWAKEILSKEYILAYAAEAEVIHIHNEKPAGVFNRYFREGLAFKQIHPEAHFNLYDFVRLAASNIFHDGVHAARESAFFRHFASIVWFRTMQFWGTYQGYRKSAELNWNLRQTFYYPRGLVRDAEEARLVKPIEYEKKD